MLHNVPRTLTVGGYCFPTRHDYLAHCGNGRAVHELDDQAIVAIQRDWHMRGQNGCVFAMHGARTLTDRQWRYEVHPRRPDGRTIRRSIMGAVEDPDNQILSLIFPMIESREGVHHLVEVARSAGCYQATEVGDGSRFVSLRYPVLHAESWVVGFAPLASLPATRQAPFTELAIRTKIKTKPLHPDLNGDVTQAHLADVDLDLDPEVVARLISKSKVRSVKILGGEPTRNANRGAKAKVTFDLSVE